MDLDLYLKTVSILHKLRCPFSTPTCSTSRRQDRAAVPSYRSQVRGNTRLARGRRVDGDWQLGVGGGGGERGGWGGDGEMGEGLERPAVASQCCHEIVCLVPTAPHTAVPGHDGRLDHPH